MLNAMVPVFSLLIAFFIFKVKVRKLQVLGIFIGLASAVGLMYGAKGSGFQANFDVTYALLVILATLCYAISLNVIKQFLQDQPSVAITGLALILVSPVGVAVLASSGFTDKLAHLEGAWWGFAAIAALAVIGTALALILFNRLVQETNTLFASSVTYLIPVVAILWGIFDGEALTWVQVACTFSMIGGIFLINRA
jgi:drug/metabolite transporter (DMT)-like permease